MKGETKDQEDISKYLAYLSEVISKAHCKITFGLQPSHTKHIETELQRWRDIPVTSDGGKANPKYIRYVWEKLGKELLWCPFTLALYYFEQLEDQSRPSQNGKETNPNRG